MKKISPGWLLVICMVLLSMQTFADSRHSSENSSSISEQQTLTVKGNVSDEKGEPLPGVSVLIKGTSSGVATDIEGNYEIKNVPVNSVLQFSYIGYLTQTITVTDQTQLDVVLKEDAKALDEVIVVGYGTQRKGAVLASIGNLNSEDLSRTTSPTTASALIGKVAGITSRQTQGTPGASAKLQIRNMGTPLYVIDGIMKDEGQFNNLDVNDIESISVVKDGAAAIYGVKAANGVIIVKTKKGTPGKLSVGVNYYHGWQSWTRFPEMANAAEYVRGDYERRVNSGELVDVETAKAEIAKWEAGYYNPETGEDYRGYDWTKFARKNVPQDYYSVNASGGSDKVTYYLALSHIDQDAVFKDYNFNRSNVQANVDAHITKSLKVGMNANGRIETRQNPGLSGDDDYWNARLAMFRARPTSRPYANDNPKYPAYLPYDAAMNLATMTKDIAGFYEETWRVFQGNWDVEWKAPVKGLTAKFLYSYYYADKKRNNFERAYDLYSYNYQTKTYDVAFRKTDSWMQKEFSGVEENMYQFTLNYENTFGSHHVSAVFAGEADKRIETNTRLAQNPVDNNFLPILTDNRDIIAYLNDSYWEGATAGFALRANYDFKGKYLVEFAGRYDGSYKFPKNNRWGFFPSVSAGWRISEENFFKNSSIGNWFTNAKFRASYGQMGDDNLGDSYKDFDYLGGYTFNQGSAVIATNPSGNIEGSFVKGSQSRKTPITNVTWLKSEIVNIGIDLGFFNNRLTTEIDYFRRKRKGLLAASSLVLPVEAGITVPVENLNSDMHTGVDGFVKWTDRVGSFNYYAGVNVSLARQKNCIVANQLFNNSWDQYRWRQDDRWANVYGGSNVWATKIIGQFQSQQEIDNYPVVMDDQGNRTVLPGDFIYADLNGDGVINDLDVRPLGYGEDLPYLTFGINLGFQWKGIDFAADFAGASMQTLVLDFEAKWPYQGDNNSPKYMINDRWHHADIFDPSSEWIPGKRPALRKDNWGEGGSYRRWNSYFMVNAKYLRLKNLEIGYTFPEKWMKKVFVQRLRIYATGTNLFSIDNLKEFGLDPEQAGRNGLDYPLHRVYTVGVNLTF